VWPSLARRASEPEQLDLGVAPSEALASLRDLRFVNRWLGGHSLQETVLPLLAEGAWSILDVGCGSADLLGLVVERARAPVRAIGLDIKPLHLQLAPPGVQRVVADVRALPFAPASFDVVTASLFLHHFDANELPGIIRSLFLLTRRALVVSDLRRARVPWVFGHLLFPLLFRSQVSVDDGLISIRRGFLDAELRRAFEQAGIEHVRIDRRFPYRLVAVARPAG
jgi:SAM-dependent methyltransferase